MITNRRNLHPVLYQAIVGNRDSYAETHTEKSDISVTQLIAPPRMVALTELHRDEIDEDAADLIWAFLGSAVHTALENAADDTYMVERRLYASTMGWKVSGMFDLLDVEDRILYDHKLCSVWEHTGPPKKEWVEQLNCLRWLCEENGLEVWQLRVQAIYRDWSRNRAMSDNYPRAQTEEIVIPLWDLQETADFVSEKVWKHQQARQELPRCTSEERWERPTKWAVMKPGRKSAIKLHDDEETAAIHIENLDQKGLFIQERPGASVRCDYCRVSEFCEQRGEYV